jgi:hypothetical protein
VGRVGSILLSWLRFGGHDKFHSFLCGLDIELELSGKTVGATLIKLFTCTGKSHGSSGGSS